MGRVWTECDYCKQPCEWTICAACESVLRDALAKVKATPPASKPAPAWEISGRDYFDIPIGDRFSVSISSDGRGGVRGRAWYSVSGLSVQVGDTVIRDTAPEAARAAVAALRTVLDEARAQLERVPELEGP